MKDHARTTTQTGSAGIDVIGTETLEYGDERGSAEDRPKVSAGYIWLLVLAILGNYVAIVAPVSISLSLRVEQLAPTNVEVLGYVVGAGALMSALTTPLVGLWSDRTRSRFGRRRQFALGGAVVGFAGLALMAVSPNIVLLAASWTLAGAGWNAAGSSLLLSQADRLPEEQRGKVAGLSGFVQMVAAVVGTGIASAFIGNNVLVFLVPGAVGVAAMVVWTLFIREDDTRMLDQSDKLSVGKVFATMVFDPSLHPDFAWNWLGRLLFNFGVTFATTFTTLFFASRIGTESEVAEIGGFIAVLAVIGVIATAGGALAGGYLSDKLGRRRVFVLFSGVVFSAGAVIMAVTDANVVVLVLGSALTNIGLGIFAAVDQAIVLDILPERDTEAGRFIGINGYSTSIAQGVAPIVAVPILLIGGVGSDKNYSLLFLIAAICTLIGGLIVMSRVRIAA